MNEAGDRVEETIRRVLRERLEPHGLRDVTVEARPDNDGDPALYVTAHFDLVDREIDPAITFGITRSLREALAEIGEHRFPYTTYDFHDDQKVTPRKRKRA